MKILGLAGWSGSGKTTLIRNLIPILIARGLRVSTLKHAHHAFDIDQPGKDSYEHRQAGAAEVLVSSANRFALMHELRGAPEPSVDELVSRMTPVDLLIIEGFKHHGHAKLEIYRAALGKTLLAPEDPHVVAVASDAFIPGLRVPILGLDDTKGIADFVIAQCQLSTSRVA